MRVFFNTTSGCLRLPDERCRPVWTNRPPPSGEDGHVYPAGTASSVSWRMTHIALNLSMDANRQVAPGPPSPWSKDRSPACGPLTSISVHDFRTPPTARPPGDTWTQTHHHSRKGAIVLTCGVLLSVPSGTAFPRQTPVSSSLRLLVPQLASARMPPSTHQTPSRSTCAINIRVEGVNKGEEPT